MADPESFDHAHAALDRMRRASERGTGCHLTADMIEALSRTFLGETWQPRDSAWNEDTQ